MNLTKEQLAKAREAKSLEELTALAKAEGVEVTPEEIEKFWNRLHGEGELADEELDNVSGGCGGMTYSDQPGINSADPRCKECGCQLVYQYQRLVDLDGRTYYCDEYRCPYSRCSANRVYNVAFLHIWEGDRWVTEIENWI